MAVAMDREVLLTNIDLNQDCKIAKINGGRELVHRLETLGLRPGKKVRKVSKIFNAGPVIIDINGRMIAVGHRQAKRILVAVD